MEEKKFCQSCAMPMEEETWGTNADGTKSGDYCSYCYQNGAFTGDMTMEEMVDFCAPMTAQSMGITEEEAVKQMNTFFPMLKRWAAKNK